MACRSKFGLGMYDWSVPWRVRLHADMTTPNQLMELPHPQLTVRAKSHYIIYVALRMHSVTWYMTCAVQTEQCAWFFKIACGQMARFSVQVRIKVRVRTGNSLF